MARQQWSSKTVFVLAAVGSAVGLGNVWRFPYLAGRYGGGAFLIPYLLAFVLMATPLLILELAIGQRMQRGPIKSLRQMHPAFGGIGLIAVISAFLVVAYYAVVMAWCLIYLIRSLGVAWADDPQGYFFGQVLQISDGVGQWGGFNLPILAALVAVWLAIYFCIWQGPKSVGKVVLYTVPLPVVVMAVLFLRSLTLPGFWQGWRLYLTPVWSAMLSPEVWTAAAAQAFLTLSVAFAIMLTYASYKQPNEDIVKSSWTTAIADLAISLFAGFVVFAVLGYMAWTTSSTVEEVTTSGPGLAFVVFPQALSLMPLPGLFSALFFFMLLTLGIDSAFSLVEPAIAAWLDLKPGTKGTHIAGWACLAAFAVGTLYTTRAGLYFLDIVDHFVTTYNAIVVALGMAILGGWVFGAEALRRYVNEVSDWQVGRWWNISIKWVVPIVLAILLATQLSTDLRTPYEGYPAWALAIGWATVLVPLGLGLWMVRGGQEVLLEAAPPEQDGTPQ
ncbi:MAG TPA: sodium-dependent transporter [Leptolyngbyaceae cyanobacterium M65_K2018_010]|nr:sodium-dependent transporter [Leptolyngbyaceae cyanobacterium M65_K2018_010]